MRACAQSMLALIGATDRTFNEILTIVHQPVSGDDEFQMIILLFYCKLNGKMFLIFISIFLLEFEFNLIASRNRQSLSSFDNDAWFGRLDEPTMPFIHRSNINVQLISVEFLFCRRL